MSTDLSRLAPDEWISQAEAARLRGVSRQAMSRLVARGRVRTMPVAGRLLVNRADLIAFEPHAAGRPSKRKPK
jgi:predicted DNA-binding protein (UPF0251 family)